MAQKRVTVPDIGEVVLQKRRGARSIRLSLAADSTIRITLPYWVPYEAGLQFVLTKKQWILDHHTSKHVFDEGQLIGKAHRLHFHPSEQVTKPRSRVHDSQIAIWHHNQQPRGSIAVQSVVERAALRALKQESETLLPSRLHLLAKQHGFSYNSVTMKQLKARWGSCSQKQDITLNIFLMQLPWTLIDYVLIHELVHTKVLHHGPDFWHTFESCLPDAKQRRKTLRSYHPYFTAP